MIESITGIEKIMLVLGRTDMRKGPYGLAIHIDLFCKMDPFQSGILWLFCGRSHKRIKGLFFDPDRGFCMFQQEVSNGSFQWPRIDGTVMELSFDQYKRLMDGYTIVSSINKPKIEKKATIEEDNDNWETVKVRFI